MLKIIICIQSGTLLGNIWGGGSNLFDSVSQNVN